MDTLYDVVVYTTFPEHVPISVHMPQKIVDIIIARDASKLKLAIYEIIDFAERRRFKADSQQEVDEILDTLSSAIRDLFGLPQTVFSLSAHKVS
ncbi:MAG: hypothetical protein KatS3mg083_146 [Candidatus Dojkabacteria bacterium]|nr:MAG: hypothetical protein KatS3mg083_146 [Candidatus Dojkabacteria bacterium]